MSIYPGKDGLTCLLSNVVKKIGVRGCIGNLTCSNFGWQYYNRRVISPLLACLLFVSRNFSSISFVNLKTKAVIPLSVVCG